MFPPGAWCASVCPQSAIVTPWPRTQTPSAPEAMCARWGWWHLIMWWPDYLLARTACVSPGSPPGARVTRSPLTQIPAAPGARAAGSASVWVSKPDLCRYHWVGFIFQRRDVIVMKTPLTLTSFVQQTSNARTASALPQDATVTQMPQIQMTSVLQIKNARTASVWRKVTPTMSDWCPCNYSVSTRMWLWRESSQRWWFLPQQLQMQAVSVSASRWASTDQSEVRTSRWRPIRGGRVSSV